LKIVGGNLPVIGHVREMYGRTWDGHDIDTTHRVAAGFGLVGFVAGTAAGYLGSVRATTGFNPGWTHSSAGWSYASRMPMKPGIWTRLGYHLRRPIQLEESQLVGEGTISAVYRSPTPGRVIRVLREAQRRKFASRENFARMGWEWGMFKVMEKLRPVSGPRAFRMVRTSHGPGIELEGFENASFYSMLMEQVRPEIFNLVAQVVWRDA
jgi:hypothetical protein